VKKLTLLTDWKLILRKAWSVRLNVVATVFSVAEVVLPVYSDAFPRGTFAILSAVTVMGSLWARVVRQKSIHDA